MNMQIEVVMERCEGHGLCAEVAPNIYSLDDEGYVAYRYSGQEVPAHDQAAADKGARVCPVAALLVRAG